MPPPPPERPLGRSIELTCPSLEVPPAGFADVAADNVHGRAIDGMRHRGLIEGVGDNSYQPAGLVNRAQMATVVARLIKESGGDMPDDPDDAFTDDEGSVHEASINKAASAGVVAGLGDGRTTPTAWSCETRWRPSSSAPSTWWSADRVGNWRWR